jgi:hypothetical protein
VGGHQYPPGRCVGLQTTPEGQNPQLQRSTKERVELKTDKRSQLEHVGGHQYPLGSIRHKEGMRFYSCRSNSMWQYMCVSDYHHTHAQT